MEPVFFGDVRPTLWTVEATPFTPCLWALNALGWLGVPVSSCFIDHLDLFGIKQAWNGFRRASLERKGFVTPLLYRYVRHPMMTSLLVGLWVTPRMTGGHLLLSAGMTAYVLVGVHFEERSLASPRRTSTSAMRRRSRQSSRPTSRRNGWASVRR